VPARLRHRKFFSLSERDAAIRTLIADLNDRPMRHLVVIRRALFERVDHAVLLPLPADQTVDLFYGGMRVASHLRSPREHRSKVLRLGGADPAQ
jgi:hypothetical protein